MNVCMILRGNFISVLIVVVSWSKLPAVEIKNSYLGSQTVVSKHILSNHPFTPINF